MYEGFKSIGKLGFQKKNHGNNHTSVKTQQQFHYQDQIFTNQQKATCALNFPHYEEVRRISKINEKEYIQ